MAFSSSQKKLLVSYFCITLVFSIAIACVHLILKLLHIAPASLLTYIPVIIIGSIVLYIKYFRKKVREVQFRGAGVTTVPTVYFMAMAAIPFLPLNLVALITDRIIEVQSSNQLRETSEPFFIISPLQPDYKKLIDTSSYKTSTDEEGQVSTQFDYTATMPVALNDQIWIVIKKIENYEDYESPVTLLEMLKDFYQASREKVLRFPFDSVRYMEKTDAPLDLLQTKKVNPAGVLFIYASLKDIFSLRISYCWIIGGTYILLTLFFVMTVATGHYEAIDND